MDDRYAAGLFDGEGYVRIARWAKPGSKHIRYQVIGGIGMTHRPVIEALREAYGGSVNMNRHDLRNKNHRIQFTWHVGSQIACDFLRRVMPHLVVKREEAEIALALQEHIDTNPYVSAGRNALRDDRTDIIAHRESLYRKISALKKRSFPPLTS